MTANSSDIAAAADLGSVRVVVTPSQSSYFAGEPFTVTVTFTNTRTPEYRPSRHGSHTRASHSISSAPLARPPTSPGTPRSPATGILPRLPVNRPVRKGFVGRLSCQTNGSGDGPRLSEQRKRAYTKSLSVSIAPRELEHRLRDQIKQDDVSSSNSSPNDPPQYPLTRSPFLSMSSKHPHARKQSVLDGQLQPHEVSHSVPHSPLPLSPFIPSASTSTFSLVLDPIAENTPMLHSPAVAPSPMPEISATMNQIAAHRTGPSLSKHVRRPSQVGLGQPPLSLSKSLAQPRTAFSSTFSQPNVELILYSYVQLVGTVHIKAPPGVAPTQSQTDTLNALRSALARRSVLGGGSMDITSSQHRQGRLPQPPAKHLTHRRATSLSSNFLSLLSPTSINVSSTPISSHTPSLRSPSSGLSGMSILPSPSLDGRNKVGLGIMATEEVDPEAPLPTFEVQPSMLAVDLPLRPGESRNYKYTIRLPDNLPPTFRGRSMQFSYELVVGTCRAGSSLSPSADAASRSSNSFSRVMKVPIRVYNHVPVGRPPLPYDLLWPVGKRIKFGSDAAVQTVEDGSRSLSNSTGRESYTGTCGSLREVQDYARVLLDSLTPSDMTSTGVRFPSDSGKGETDLDEGGLTGCREAVDLLTRNFKKVSYDVNKDGVKVAVLTFTKSAYRLGETVLGVVELNERTSLARVLKLSARLESQETLPSSVSPPPPIRNMRRVHAEHHSSFVLSTLRTTFSLDIPSDASPAFQVHVGREIGTGGLEWKVKLCLLVAVASESSVCGTEGVRVKSLVRDRPRGRWESAWSATKGISPLECPADVRVPKEGTPVQSRSWMSFLTSSLLGIEEDEGGVVEESGDVDEDGYDGVRVSWEGGVGVGVDFGGGEDGWGDMRVEMVECEVPVKVWAGNTAFKAVEIEFYV